MTEMTEITKGSLFQGFTAQPLDHLARKYTHQWKAPVFVYNISLLWVIFRETVSAVDEIGNWQF
jgi:hypothetical protein